MLVNRTEQHQINKNHSYYKLIDELCFKSKNIYNYANYISRQIFVITSKLNNNKEITNVEQEYLTWINSKVDEFNLYKVNNLKKKQLSKKSKDKYKDTKHKQYKYFNKDNRFPTYDFIEFVCKHSDPFIDLGSQCSQSTLKVLDKAWKSFFKSIKDWSKNPSKYLGRPKLPKYKHKINGRYPLYVANNQCRFENGYLYFSWNPLKSLNDTIKTNISGKLMQVRFIPRNNVYIMEIVYQTEVTEISNIEPTNICGIDLGLNNFATLTNNVGIKPIVINGKILKSINQYYNKQLAYYRSILKKTNNKDWSNKLDSLTLKRFNKIKNYMHKASKMTIEYCINNNIDTIVIGNNKNWKQESNMSKKVNQSFVQIPYEIFIQQIQYKAENVSINVIITEESYTSGTSFLDNELPCKDFYNKSRRIYRGIFKSNNNILINADVNGSYQIIKKVVPKAFADGIEGVGLHPIVISL